MLILVIELVLLFLIFFTLITQVIIPAFKGTLLFPFFRKTAELEVKLAEAHQAEAEAVLVQEVKKARKAVRKVKQQS